MEPNKMDKQFKEQLNLREIKPSEMAWDKLEAMLTIADEKPKRNFKWFYVAASISGFLMVGTVYFNRSETVKINNDNIVLEQKTDVNHLDEPKIINKGVLSGQIQKKVTKPQTVVAYNNAPKKQLNQLKNEEQLSIISPLNEESVVVNSSENKNYLSTDKNKYISAEKLLAEVSNAKFETKGTDETVEKTRKAISVNPNHLLLNAETELNQSYRESALDRFNKKFNAVKTVLVNRNYEE